MTRVDVLVFDGVDDLDAAAGHHHRGETGRILTSSQYLVGFPTPLNLDGQEQLAAGLHPVAK